MKKLLFVLMLAVMGNALAGTTVQKNRNTSMNMVSGSEKIKIENAFQKDMENIKKIVENQTLAEVIKDSFSNNADLLFDKDYKISDLNKKKILEKFSKGCSDIYLKNMKLRFEVKNIKSIDNKNVEVVYDVKMKDFDKALEGIEKRFEENVRINVLKKSGYKSEDEIEALMVKNGNESEKVRIYDIMVDEILDIIGKGFVTNRYMSLFFTTLIVIGIMERNGLKEKAADGIRKIKGASAGLVIWLYLLIRWIAAIFSLRLGGHIQFVRPLILPMAEGAATKTVDLTETKLEDLKGLAGAVENYGNFFGQNIFPVSSGVLLIVSTLKDKGHTITGAQVAYYSLFAGVAMIILSIVQCFLFEMKLRKAGEKNVKMDK